MTLHHEIFQYAFPKSKISLFNYNISTPKKIHHKFNIKHTVDTKISSTVPKMSFMDSIFPTQDPLKIHSEHLAVMSP